jgi:transcriptional regulator with PAS, ATPase and Fis domain
VEKKEFRQDLFFRLNVVPIHVTPLRNRPEDVLLLKNEFIRRFSRRHGVHIKGCTEEARQILLRHSWPGNVRELQNVVERAVILCGDNGMLEPQHLGLTVSNQPNQIAPANVAGKPFAFDPGQHAKFPTLSEIEKRHILAALEHCKNNRTHAAKLLEVSIRTLRNKLHEYKHIEPQFDESKMSVEA